MKKIFVANLGKEWKISLTYLHHQFLCERPSILKFSMHQHIPIGNEINCKLKTGYKFCKSCHCLVLTTSHAPFGNRKIYPTPSLKTKVSFIFLRILASFIRTLIGFLIYFQSPDNNGSRFVISKIWVVCCDFLSVLDCT